MDSVASNSPYSMTEFGDGVLELDMLLADAIAEEVKPVKEAVCKVKIVAELSISVEDIDEFATSVAEIMVVDAVLVMKDKRLSSHGRNSTRTRNRSCR
jgi:hypothetical protein